MVKFGKFGLAVLSLVLFSYFLTYIVPSFAAVVPGLGPYRNDTGDLVPIWVNTSGADGKIDIFFANGSQVFIVANFSCTANEGCNASASADANFTEIGWLESGGFRKGVYKTNASDGTWVLFEFNATVNFTEAQLANIQVAPKMVYVNATAANGSTSPPGLNAPVLIVNMSRFGCPPPGQQVPFPPVPGWNISEGQPILTPIQPTGCTQNSTLCAYMDFYGPGTWDDVANEWKICAPNFGGATTNMTAIAESGNFSAIEHFTVEVPRKGKIVFNQKVSFGTQQQAQQVMEFALQSLMSGGKIGINDTRFSNLNMSANLTIYNISQYGIVGKGRPQIYRFAHRSSSGSPCPPNICSNFLWDGENITFTVSSFSDYGLNDSINVTLVGPNLNGTITSPSLPLDPNYPANRINFTFTPVWAADVSIKNCTLYGNFSGSWAENATNQTPLVSGSVNGIVNNVTDGHYKWNIYCYDVNDQYDYEIYNSTLIVAIPPIVNETIPVDGGYIQGTSSQLFQVNVYDYNLNTSNVTLRYQFPAIESGFPSSASLNCYGSAPSFICNTTLDLSTNSEGISIEYFFEATDNATNYASNGTAANPLNTTIDRTAPKYANLGTNVTNDTTVARGTVIEISVNWTENYVLDSYILSHNGTGWSNTSSSFSGTWSNVTIDTINFANGVLFQAKIYANDTAGNENVTLTYQWTIDGTPPSYTNLISNVTNNTQIAKGTIIKLSAQWYDGIELDKYILSSNETGSWVNASALSFTSGNWSNVTIDTSSLSAGTLFQAKIYANDTSNNQNVTLTYQWVIDYEIPKYFNNGTNSTTGYAKSILLYANWSDNVGLDIAVLETNETGVLENKTYGTCSYCSGIDLETQTWSNFSWYNSSVASGTVIQWRIYVNDTTGNENATPVRTFVFDKINPVLTITTPVNNSYNNSLAGYGWINGTVYDDVAMSSENVSITGTNAYVVYSFSGANNTAFAIQNSTPISDGQITVTIGYADAAGNTHNVTIVFYKDTSGPTAAYGLTNSSNGTYQSSSSQTVLVRVDDALQTNETIILHYYINGSWFTTTMVGTPGTSTIYTATINTKANVSGYGNCDGKDCVPYYITGVDNATNLISAAVGGSASTNLSSIIIDEYCGNNGNALAYCSYDEGWKGITTGAINQFHEVHWSSWQLSGATSLNGDYNISNVLSSIDGKYSFVYYRNYSSTTTPWLSYDPNIAWNLNTLRFGNNTDVVYYINITAPGAVIRIP